MIFSAILSFLGGATARALIGHVISWLEKKQAHAQEQDSLRLQAELDQGRHQRQKELIELQAGLNVTEIKLVGEQASDLEAAKAFTEAMKRANAPTGNRFIDAWNGGVRPATATLALGLWAAKFIQGGLVVTAWDESLIGSVIGFFFADRQLGKRK